MANIEQVAARAIGGEPLGSKALPAQQAHRTDGEPLGPKALPAQASSSDSLFICPTHRTPTTNTSPHAHRYRGDSRPPKAHALMRPQALRLLNRQRVLAFAARVARFHGEATPLRPPLLSRDHALETVPVARPTSARCAVQVSETSAEGSVEADWNGLGGD